ncbi:kinesin-like nuclear fusion protein [Fusarium piperis]|uniref:Kinesin-like protein n=1 Tax=Fusarium piperis TaxID=1435070 RepID=A0A9W8WMZ9_9HYPO|nr:kinesin-like nuclear fusion protein [Fusarium piperis]
MDTSFRSSKMSRLPAPSTQIGGGGLTEWSESQHNARIQSTMTSLASLKNLKREIPQPASQSEAKRKPLSDRALEYPAKPTSLAAAPSAVRSNMKPQSLAGMSGLKQPSASQSRLGTSTSSNFAKSVGPNRYAPSNPPRTATRPGHMRSKSQAPRPRTAHGLREEDRYDSGEPTNVTSQISNMATKRHDNVSNGKIPAVPPKPSKEQQVQRKLDQFQESLSLSPVKTFTSPTKSPCPSKSFLTKDSKLTSYVAWDVDGRVVDMESQFKELKEMVNTTLSERKGQDDALELAKTRVKELENDREKLDMRNESLKADLDMAREEGRHIRHEMEKQKWEQTRRMEDQERKHRETMDDMARQHRSAVDEMRRELERLKEHEARNNEQKIGDLTRQYQQELESERQRKDREIQELRTRMGNEYQDMGMALQKRERELKEVNSQVESLQGDLERERTLKNSLQTNIAELSAANTTLEAKINSLRSHVEFLESDSKAQSDSFANMEARLQDALRAAEEAQQKLIKEETERRVLFNKYQELKGNIRVMCRVRPPLGDGEGEQAKMSFPDDKTSAEIVLAGPEEKSSLGHVTRKNYPFEFDRVFIPGTQNQEIFGEISQLVQSALDGYNVCIFCYGQTGSGKTFTMSSADGMIPRATHMIYDTITKLKEKSWEYTMEGSFVEVYNEELNDLLTPNERSSESRPKKLEIRHDESRKQTVIMNCKSVRLNSPSSVETMLAEAQNNRSVAATKANERSSRSHSVFILKLVGENSATGERCEGTLNLVDLAGSERLKHSQAEGDRMKETQNINKSLSCLGDVIEALGRGTGHVPYRNSKLTHLLQYSLGGNSKTLMFVMVSPLETHLKETLTSLRFATKVHNTHIGTAKATKKIRDSS